MHPELLDNSAFLRYYKTWQENPSSIVFVPIAEFFLKYNMYDEAINVLRMGLYYHPNLITARLAASKAHLAKKDYVSAREHACHALRVMPSNIGAVNILNEVRKFLTASAMPKIENNIEKEVITAYSKLHEEPAFDIPTEENEDEPRFNTITMARLYLSQGHIKKAERVFHNILKREPDNRLAREGLNEIST